MAFLLYAGARGLFLQPCRDPATLARTQRGSAKQTLLLSEKEARGLYKKIGELLMALSQRLGGSSCRYAEAPRPRLAPKGASANKPSRARGV